MPLNDYQKMIVRFFSSSLFWFPPTLTLILVVIMGYRFPDNEITPEMVSALYLIIFVGTLKLTRRGSRSTFPRNGKKDNNDS